MGRDEGRGDFSSALSAIIVLALIVATTAVMLVTLNTKAAAVAGLEPVLAAKGTGFATRPADRP